MQGIGGGQGDQVSRDGGGQGDQVSRDGGGAGRPGWGDSE